MVEIRPQWAKQWSYLHPSTCAMLWPYVASLGLRLWASASAFIMDNTLSEAASFVVSIYKPTPIQAITCADICFIRSVECQKIRPLGTRPSTSVGRCILSDIKQARTRAGSKYTPRHHYMHSLFFIYVQTIIVSDHFSGSIL